MKYDKVSNLVIYIFKFRKFQFFYNTTWYIRTKAFLTLNLNNYIINKLLAVEK